MQRHFGLAMRLVRKQRQIQTGLLHIAIVYPPSNFQVAMPNMAQSDANGN